MALHENLLRVTIFPCLHLFSEDSFAVYTLGSRMQSRPLKTHTLTRTLLFLLEQFENLSRHIFPRVRQHCQNVGFYTSINDFIQRFMQKTGSLPVLWVVRTEKNEKQKSNENNSNTRELQTRTSTSTCVCTRFNLLCFCAWSKKKAPWKASFYFFFTKKVTCDNLFPPLRHSR